MTRRTMRAATWLGTAVLVILVARSLAYATVPSPAARALEHRGGGPALPLVVLVALALGASLAIAVCWLAALGVKERALIEQRAVAAFRPGRVLTLALLLAVATSIGGGLFEAYIHWRAGLGWHGLHCIVGPVHQQLLPFEWSLSLVGGALIAAAEHVVAWMRRTFATLRALPPRTAPLQPRLLPSLDVPRVALQLAAGPRAPPALS